VPNSPRLSRALEKLEFMVAVDIYVNETTRHAM
jgi:anaerobic selenocysteine-containing dehydrogenase